VFAGCTNLTSVIFQGITPPTFGNNIVFDSTHSNLRILVPEGRANIYRAVANLNTWRHRIHRVGCNTSNAAPGNTCICL
jgi:hypothetical protein